MNATARHNPADWPPEPGLFRMRMVRGGPFVAAQIRHSFGFWSAALNGQDMGARHTDPAQAGGVAEVWERGERIDFATFTALISNPPSAPKQKIDVGGMPPIAFKEPAMSATNVIPLHGRNLPAIDLAAALEPEALAAWIADRLTLHTDRAGELLAAHKRFLLATAAGIASEDVAAKATDFVRQIKAAINETDSERVRIKAPVLAAQRAIDGAAKAITDPLLVASTECERRVTVFMREQDRRVREAAAQEAARAAEAAALLIDQAVANDNLDAIEWAAEAESEQIAAEAIVHAPTADLTRIRTTNGSTSSLRDNWIYEIEDLGKVPTHFLMINDAAVKAAIKGGSRNIPGLAIRNQPKVGIR